ncbi:MAG: 1-acyl-sn-glycerol-3-phosphate acyltransferase [Candidatus Omnitrophica bacterium]|nr:1-acyl-sn-glycerol-3-phosphate acyltransferase [Candidatus Omnitrophota bacterium]MBU1871266.1 1-acyl-sn-glycerol-3-phosphate acyltransferase [Candidatus Omnitrophota bacterium]
MEGIENLPQKSNFIVVSNHVSFLDPLAVGTAIPRKIYWLAFRGIYKLSWIKWFLKMTETFPTSGSSNKAIHLLENNNNNIGLFPEGTRSPDGKLREFRRGAALLALKTGRPIIPCAVLGTYKALPIKAKLPRLTPIKVKIGKPIYLLKQFDDVIDDIHLQEGIFKIRNSIKEMLDAG